MAVFFESGGPLVRWMCVFLESGDALDDIEGLDGRISRAWRQLGGWRCVFLEPGGPPGAFYTYLYGKRPPAEHLGVWTGGHPTCLRPLGAGVEPQHL